MSPFSGIDGRDINPANISGTPYIWDVKFLGVHAYIDNNYMFIRDESALSSLGRSLDGEPTNYANEWETERGGAVGLLLHDYDNTSVKRAHFKTVVSLPSLMFDFDRFTLALHNDFRVAFSVIGVNSGLAKWLYEGLHYEDLRGQLIRENNFRLAIGSWLENGLTFSKPLKQSYERKSFGAITYSYLSGANNYYIIGKDAAFVYPNSADINFNNLDLDYGHALSLDDPKQFFGRGHSISLGYILQEKRDRSRYEFCYSFRGIIPKYIYKWRLGVSLLDIGYIKFHKPGSVRYNYEGVDHYWVDFEDFQFEGIEAMDELVQDHFMDSSIPTIDDEYVVLLPWALSVQYDQNILETDIYISSSVVQRIPHFNAAGYDRANTMTLTPRYDKRAFAVALPFTIYEYRYPRLGVSIRLGKYFSLGTLNVSSFIRKKHLDSGSIYFSFRYGIM